MCGVYGHPFVSVTKASFMNAGNSYKKCPILSIEVGGTQLSDFKMAKSNPSLYGAKYGENMSRDGVSIAVIVGVLCLVAMCIKRPKRTPRKSIFVRLSRALNIRVCFAVKMS